jgi:adenosylcobinamide kinase/adenosylcobinamide-phosphate guanylyltransferase
MAASKKILVTGGARSGKSRYAIQRANAMGGKKIFLATAQASDEEMDQKIKRHRQDRGESFQTIEEPLYLAKAIGHLKENPSVVVVDCLTVWVNNLLHHIKDVKMIEEQKNLFIDAVDHFDSTIIIVSNEVGMGIMPGDEFARSFANELGFLNQSIARLSDELVLMVSGVPHWVKGR